MGPPPCTWGPRSSVRSAYGERRPWLNCTVREFAIEGDDQNSLITRFPILPFLGRKSISQSRATAPLRRCCRTVPSSFQSFEDWPSIDVFSPAETSDCTVYYVCVIRSRYSSSLLVLGCGHTPVSHLAVSTVLLLLHLLVCIDCVAGCLGNALMIG